MYLFFCADISTDYCNLSEQESKHCIKVLRKKVGDIIYLFDGNGTKAKGKINSIGKKQVQVEIVKRISVSPSSYKLHIGISPTKQISKTEWFVEKAVEFGIHEISFLETKNSERARLNMERMYKILLSACKQSLSAYLPTLNDLSSFNEFVNDKNNGEKFIATLHGEPESFEPERERNTICLVGPEGGFTQTEIELATQRGFNPVTLGQKRLRTETAGIHIASIYHHLNR